MTKRLDLGSADSLKRRLLRELLQEWEAIGPPGIVDVHELAVRLSARPAEVHKAAKPLFTDGIVDRDAVGLALFFNP